MRMSDNFYCPLPFKHAFIDSSGVAACCQTPRHKVSLEEWVSHPKLLELQQALLENRVSKTCESCAKQEEFQGHSLRTSSLKDYNHKRFTKTDIDFIDYRSFNICNFKCRSCSPEFSHGIGQEAKQNKELERFFGNVPESKTISVDDTNVEWINKNLHKFNRIMFTGGEPTKIPGVRKLIEYISKYQRKIQIIMITNASFSDKFWYDITESLPNMHWTVSIDSVGESASIVRHGSDWNLVEKNVRWLAENANSLDINSTVTNLTVFQLGPLLTFGRDMQKLSASPSGKHGDLGCRHQFFICTRPFYLSADNLSEDLLVQAVDYLTSCTKLDLDDEQSQMLNGLITQLSNAKYDSALWTKSQRYNTILDQSRNQDHNSLYEVHR